MLPLLTALRVGAATYLAVSLGLGVAFVVIEKRERIPPERLRRWRADALAFMVGWPIAAVLVPAVLLANAIRRPRG